MKCMPSTSFYIFEETKAGPNAPEWRRQLWKTMKMKAAQLVGQFHAGVTLAVRLIIIIQNS
jgi:hypothetical protein